MNDGRSGDGRGENSSVRDTYYTLKIEVLGIQNTGSYEVVLGFRLPVVVGGGGGSGGVGRSPHRDSRLTWLTHVTDRGWGGTRVEKGHTARGGGGTQ